MQPFQVELIQRFAFGWLVQGFRTGSMMSVPRRASNRVMRRPGSTLAGFEGPTGASPPWFVGQGRGLEGSEKSASPEESGIAS